MMIMFDVKPRPERGLLDVSVRYTSCRIEDL